MSLKSFLFWSLEYYGISKCLLLLWTLSTSTSIVGRKKNIYYSISQLLRLKLILSIFSKNISLSHRIFFQIKQKIDVFAHSTCHRQDFCQTYNFHFPSGMCIEQRALAAFWWQILIMAVWWLYVCMSRRVAFIFFRTCRQCAWWCASTLESVEKKN